MKTPAGKECKFYYADHHRGRQIQECRLIARNRESERWQPGLCFDCPMPDIQRANSCPNLKLEGRVERRFLGLRKQVVIEGWCSEYFCDVGNPQVGCGHCHEFKRPSILDLVDED
ncbi:MAG: hypothetical protein ACE5H9_14440 [Anaerolineae bacterium]